MFKLKKKGKSSKALPTVQPAEKGYGVNRVGPQLCKGPLPSQPSKRRVPRTGPTSRRRTTKALELFELFKEQIKELIIVGVGTEPESGLSRARSALERVTAIQLAKLMRSYQGSMKAKEKKSKCAIPANFSFPVDLVENDIFVQIASKEKYNIKLKITEVRKVEAPLLPLPGGSFDV